MSDRLSWMLPSLPLPKFGTLRIYVSLYFLLIGAVFGFRFGWSLGMTITGVLLTSVLLHELGHVVAARLTGGLATEIHLSPVGGLAPVQPGRGTVAQLLTASAGPFVNLLLCIVSLSLRYAPETLWDIVRNPLVLPISSISPDKFFHDLGLLVFALNWLMLLVNLLPIMPLDGGQIVRALLATRIHPELVGRAVVHFGLAASFLLMLVGLVGDLSVIVFLGAALLVINLVQLFDEQTSDEMDDSFLGYDFSEGYTSLERSAPSPARPREARQSLLRRWREQRRLRREQEERRQREDAERQLDGLLAKVHEHGMASLTSVEQRLLKQVSDLLRERGKRTS